MLFKKKFLNLIKQNEVRVAFRKWVRPTVKENGTLLTPIGQLRIKSLSKVTYAQIADREVRKAGYQSRQELDKELGMKENGDIYKIIFELEQPDPRIALRENTHLSDSDIIELLKKLERLDTRGKVKDWTRKVLCLVHEDPGQLAVYYAGKLGYEKEWFKRNIRKLKNLGLTISLANGYEISPRGKAFLKNTAHIT